MARVSDAVTSKRRDNGGSLHEERGREGRLAAISDKHGDNGGEHGDRDEHGDRPGARRWLPIQIYKERRPAVGRHTATAEMGRCGEEVSDARRTTATSGIGEEGDVDGDGVFCVFAATLPEAARATNLLRRTRRRLTATVRRCGDLWVSERDFGNARRGRRELPVGRCTRLLGLDSSIGPGWPSEADDLTLS
ncbi:hypothetical protein Scep_016852 [Stephania cephalantha]|uniref:Uncharacterized protein n=1 Tax=Stephania cephalantha TaxID=152367 RepID=A0AAP0INF7_9MAGN